jgi:predicted FMN-binding regulatory protein PaiB
MEGTTSLGRSRTPEIHPVATQGHRRHRAEVAAFQANETGQNRPEQDRQGTVRGLEETGDASAAALAKMTADLPR